MQVGADIILSNPPPTNRIFSFDCETHRITLQQPVPPMVCMSYSFEGREGVLGGTIEGKASASEMFLAALNDPSVTLVGHNVFYDLSVMLFHLGNTLELRRVIDREMAAGRIRDTGIIAKLVAIQHDWLRFDPLLLTRPKFSLEWLAKRYIGVDIEGKHGEDAWRMRYHELDGIPVDMWPPAAYSYALLDAVHTESLYHALRRSFTASPDEVFQTQKQWALRYAEIWGAETHEPTINALENEIRPRVAAVQESLRQVGIYRTKPAKVLAAEVRKYVVEKFNPPTDSLAKKVVEKYAGDDPIVRAYLARDVDTLIAAGFAEPPGLTKNAKAVQSLVASWYKDHDIEVPLTEKGGVSTNRMALEATDDENLLALASIGSDQTLLNTFIPAFRAGVVHPRWNGLVATGRVSVSKPNLNNVPRQGGVRECFRAREGYYYLTADLKQAEMCALAQICLDKFGYSSMAEAILAGKDLHLTFAAGLLGISYEEATERYEAGDEAVAKARQLAKVANFGFPGGQGVRSFQTFALKQGVRLTLDDVYNLREAWLATYPEVGMLFRWVNDQCNRDSSGRFTFVQHRSGRRRGGCGYTDGCNTGFQGLIADAVGDVTVETSRECYTDPTSPLYGSHIVAQIYDELWLEVPIDSSAAAAERLEGLIKTVVKRWTPDLPVSTSPELMLHWSKGSMQAFDDDGMLVPFDLEEDNE